MKENDSGDDGSDCSDSGPDSICGSKRKRFDGQRQQEYTQRHCAGSEDGRPQAGESV